MGITRVDSASKIFNAMQVKEIFKGGSLFCLDIVLIFNSHPPAIDAMEYIIQKCNMGCPTQNVRHLKHSICLRRCDLEISM